MVDWSKWFERSECSIFNLDACVYLKINSYPLRKESLFGDTLGGNWLTKIGALVNQTTSMEVKIVVSFGSDLARQIMVLGMMILVHIQNHYQFAKNSSIKINYWTILSYLSYVSNKLQLQVFSVTCLHIA